ncbi:MAG: hypothetical protein DI536_04305 [Archangium gephyra]|uniref:Uncharacterized protein n=1 Tax=Archangium gephyra TaxID=48 RepID=A0A2W5TSF9_9BACT|nr:MAG: hypothetical protein DI536_04305 [Archangium gephyra]
MEFFKYDHLPPEKQQHSKPFGELAEIIHSTLPRNPERSVALRKLLEAKDAAVRAGFMVLLALIVFLPSLAFAQTVTLPASSPTLLERLLSPELIATIVGAVIAGVFTFLKLDENRKKQIAIVTGHAYHLVNDLAATTSNTIDDKVAVGLRVADEYMRAQGWRPLKPNEKEVVKLDFSALHGQQAEAVKTQAEAIKAATANPPSP